jgi:hypothetical protein
VIHYDPKEKIEPPCKFLVADDRRYWCGLVIEAEGQEKINLEKDLAIGCGCSSSLLNTQRNRQIKRMQ